MITQRVNFGAALVQRGSSPEWEFRLKESRKLSDVELVSPPRFKAADMLKMATLVVARIERKRRRMREDDTNLFWETYDPYVDARNLGVVKTMEAYIYHNYSPLALPLPDPPGLKGKVCQ